MAFHKGFGKRRKGKKRANYMADLFWTSSFKGKSQKARASFCQRLWSRAVPLELLPSTATTAPPIHPDPQSIIETDVDHAASNVSFWYSGKSMGQSFVEFEFQDEGSLRQFHVCALRSSMIGSPWKSWCPSRHGLHAPSRVGWTFRTDLLKSPLFPMPNLASRDRGTLCD